MPKTFVIGDIHGACRALLQVLQRANFNYEEDHLIALGDVCDGWPETKDSIDELLKIKKLTYILGNHDYWMEQWMKTGRADSIWLKQGGQATLTSYSGVIPASHISFLERAHSYFLLENTLFVHAGINPARAIENQDVDMFLWDRTLVNMAVDFHRKDPHHRLTTYDEVYVGHTPIEGGKPMRACEVWLMDTGAGWSGVLSMMNSESKEIFTSDPVPTLYPGVEGRKKIA